MSQFDAKMGNDDECYPKMKNRTSMYILVFLAICRLLSMALIPLNDTTEARYAEIARKMLEIGDWITPMIDYQHPFWGKPPLCFWLSALSMKLFGVNAFAARVPAFIASIGSILLIRHLTTIATQRNNMTVTLLLAGNLFFFLDAGTVMTEPMLLFALSLAMWSFWLAMLQKRMIMSLSFFGALGIGLLAKGPIAVILIAGAILIWTVWNHQWHKLWHHLHWFAGILFMLLIALPWYMLAELKTPGFLNYFIIGEHFRRYIQPGWAGDQYGYVHAVPMGTIWLYALGATLPWSLVFVRCLKPSPSPPAPLPKAGEGSEIMTSLPKAGEGNEIMTSLPKPEQASGRVTSLLMTPVSKNFLWSRYLLVWLLFPLLFFTPARNIIYPYVFPILPALALWVDHLIHHRSDLYPKNLHMIQISTIFTGVIFLLVSGIFVLKPQWISSTQKYIIARWDIENPPKTSVLYYWTPNPIHYSALFYTQGQADALHDANHLCTLLQTNKIQYLVIEDPLNNPLPNCAIHYFSTLETLQAGKKIFTLLKIRES